MYSIWKGVYTLPVPPWSYLSGRRRKKNAIQARSEMAYFLGVLPWDVVLRQRRIDIGPERTLDGEIHSLVWASSYCNNLKSRLPTVLCLGLLVSTDFCFTQCKRGIAPDCSFGWEVGWLQALLPKTSLLLFLGRAWGL